jgi:hypothetical protein
MKQRRILRNAARCRKCDDVVESESLYDFRRCSCEAITIDGGRAYLKRCGNYEDIEEMSEYGD